MQWLDIAEGDHSLLVVGNLESNKNELSPLMAFLETDAAGPKVGDVRTAFLPTYGVSPVRLRGVASFIEEIVPLAPGEHKARFAVTGDVQELPWHFLIGEDGVIEWQKRYRTSAGFKASWRRPSGPPSTTSSPVGRSRWEPGPGASSSRRWPPTRRPAPFPAPTASRSIFRSRSSTSSTR